MAVTRDTFLSTKHYDKLIEQEAVPVIDADINEMQDIQRNRLHALILQTIGDGFVDNGFKIVGSGASNDFSIKAGNGFVNGRISVKETDETYNIQADYAAPTALTTPSISRTDTVYLHVYEEVIDGAQDPNIIDPTYGAETCQRVKLRYAVGVAEGGTTPANDASNWYTPLATIARIAGQDAINVGDVTDIRLRVTIPLNLLPAISSEVTAARGSMSSVSARLTIALNDNGTLKTKSQAHADLSDMPDATGVVTDHDARYSIGAGGGTNAAHNKAILANQASNSGGAGLIGNLSVDDTVNQTANAGAATTLYGRLSEFAAAIKGIIGTANWFDAIPASLTALWAEFNAASGHAHTGGTNDAPMLLSTGIADNAIVTSKILNGAVTNDKVAEGTLTADKFDASVNLPLPGSIVMYGGIAAPTGYLLCDGSAVSRTTYAALYAVLAVSFGLGNGSTTFNLPDLRGRMPVGYGAGAGLTPRALNDSGGEETHVLTATESGLRDHTHGGGCNSAIVIPSGGANYLGTGGPVATGGVTGGPVSGSSHNNMPPYLGVNFIIKY
jgi:microcystin-dependent protein